MIVTRAALGLVEFVNIAQGIEATDVMVKAAPVELVHSLSLCPGKFISLVAGPVSAVEGSVAAGIGFAPEKVIDYLIIPNIHPEVIPALVGATSLEVGVNAIGIIETFSAAAAIKAGDAAVKMGQVHLQEIRLARGMGGKGLVLLTGNNAAVEAAIRAGKNCVNDGFIVSTAFISAPSLVLLNRIL